MPSSTPLCTNDVSYPCSERIMALCVRAKQIGSACGAGAGDGQQEPDRPCEFGSPRASCHSIAGERYTACEDSVPCAGQVHAQDAKAKRFDSRARRRGWARHAAPRQRMVDDARATPIGWGG